MTPKQRMVLQAIAEWTPRSGRTHPDHRDITMHCGGEYCRADWAHRAIRALLADGLIEVVRIHRGARTYRPTPAGWDAIGKKMDGAA